jgi:hypothetical protein
MRPVNPHELINIPSHVFVKSDDSFFTGYNQQYVYFQDDLWKDVTELNPDNEFSLFMSLVNPFSKPLKMAGIADKGKVFLNSPVVICSTNCSDLRAACAKSIIDYTALARRIHHSIRLIPMPHVLDARGNFNFDLYTSLSPAEQYAAWEVHDIDFTNSSTLSYDTSPVTNRRTFSAFTEEVVSHIKENMRLFIKAEESKRNVMRFHTQMSSDPEYWTRLAATPAVARPPPTLPTPPVTGWVLQSGLSDVTLDVAVDSESVYHDAESYYPNPFTDPGTSASHITWKMIDIQEDDAVSVSEAEMTKVALLKEFINSIFLELESYKDYLYKTWVSFKTSTLYTWLTSTVGKLCLVGLATGLTAFAAYSKISPKKGAIEALPRVSKNHISDTSKIIPTKFGNIIENKIELQGLAQSVIARRKAVNNSYDITLSCADGNRHAGSCIFVRGNVAILPAHYFDIIQRHHDNHEVISVDFSPSFGSIRHTFSMTIQDFLNLTKHYINASLDFAAMRVPNITAHTDIVTFFLKEDDLRVFNKRHVPVFVDFSDWSEGTHMIKRHCTTTTFEIGPKTLGTVHNDRILVYASRSVFGDCGAAVYLENCGATMQRQIVGFHVAGSDEESIGCAAVITQEMLHKAFDMFSPAQDVSLPDVEIGDVGTLAYQGFQVLAATKPMNMCRKSSLVRTPIIYPTTDAPALLYPKKGVNPMEVALKGYAGSVTTLCSDKLAECSVAAFAPFFGATDKCRRSVVSVEDAIRSTIDNKGISRSTSTGYPYCTLNIGKKDLWGPDGEYDFTSKAHKELVEDINVHIDMARRNERGLHIFADFLKDEIRPIEKVIAGKTRLISACPVLYNVLCRMYFLDFINAVQSTRIINGVAVGTNPYSEWTILANALLRKGNNILAGDFSGFDKSQIPQILWSLVDRINEWYDDGPENAQIRRVLWLEVVNSRHVGGDGSKSDVLYAWHKSLPSGHPLTTVINSFYNLTALACCWYEWANKHMPFDIWRSYRFHVKCIVYGDDNLISVSDTVRLFAEPFDQRAVTKYMALIGLDYTSEKKDGSEFSYRPITEVEFLKRSFNPVTCGKTTYLPTLRLESVIKSVLWTRNKLGVEDINNTFDTFFAELSLHDSETWSLHASYFRDQAQLHYGYNPLLCGVGFNQDAHRTRCLKLESQY